MDTINKNVSRPITGSSERKVAKLRESSAWLRLAGAYQNRAFFLHKPVHSYPVLYCTSTDRMTSMRPRAYILSVNMKYSCNSIEIPARRRGSERGAGISPLPFPILAHINYCICSKCRRIGCVIARYIFNAGSRNLSFDFILTNL